MANFFEYFFNEFNYPLTNPVLVFSVILFIILLAPIILRKLNIPGIIGLIISGMIIGPYGANILEKNSAVELFSTIGLLYIMFIAGLDLDLNEFKANRNKSFLFGLFTFIIPMSIGFPVCHYLLGYDLNASFLTASMFSTHTLVAYPIVSRLGVSKNQAVAITVGGTILTDTAVLITLAVIIGNSSGSLNQEFWIRLGISLIIFSAIMFLVVPKIARWFFQKMESEKHAHYIFVLSIVFFAAFLAEVSGLEPIIGAFVAGLALNPLIPHSSALMNRIEFIGNSLFIPFFLISVGMLVDISVILRGPEAVIIAVVLTLVALFGKWFAALFTQLIFKYSGAQRQLIFGLSSSHAAATLAVILVGYQSDILDENILNGTIILILITCIVASFATEKAAKKLLLSRQKDTFSVEKTTTGTREHILLPIANILNVEKLLEFALLIKDKKSPNPISILSVVPNNDQAEANIITTRSKLEEQVRQGAATETRIDSITTIDHNPVSGISRISKEIMADIIILGWPQKTSLIDKLLGEKMNSLINNISKNLFVCFLEKPFVVQKRIVIISPPLSEREDGFELWVQKIFRLSNELSIPVLHFGNANTQNEIQELIQKRHLTVIISFQTFEGIEDFSVISEQTNPDDLVIFISARRNSVSYYSLLDNIPHKLEKHFTNNNIIVVYPQQFNHFQKEYDDLSDLSGFRSIETIGTLGKGISKIFKKE
ncbi:MAG: sodium:proton antiporter [Bacteroidetes bacterium GWF2_42_66]|nr:MAG: sodium:proton antiporter [Bacteroidetes bacterium GWA2_42_15]OFY02717.1 MAG: sodium:proton antiporter [Bacteroidetes bacterium GWE2_42_39]OFY43916.1 MAG: sodium:proton antiporter [Bacteroidetes bacterium GWF2_42_66]HBL77560.1 sodium:proton antiporter [Prolixibacteraceae bacterium]HCR89992.1 sodium:proton antiporter [Prolixibacteraceae bacterium]